LNFATDPAEHHIDKGAKRLLVASSAVRLHSRREKPVKRQKTYEFLELTIVWSATHWLLVGGKPLRLTVGYELQARSGLRAIASLATLADRSADGKAAAQQLY
jgi:hypothetical protein